MFNIPANVCVYLCTKPTDMRKGFDGLYAMVLQVFQRDPLDGHPCSERRTPRVIGCAPRPRAAAGVESSRVAGKSAAADPSGESAVARLTCERR